MVEIKYTVQDGGSGVADSKILLDGSEIKADEMDLALLSLGDHNLIITAQDKAGNVGVQEIKFKISTDLASIIANVRHYAALKLITNRGTETSLEARLRSIQGQARLLAVFQSRWLPRFLRDRLAANFQENIRRRIAELETQLQKNKKFQKTIVPRARELLLEDLESLKV